MNQSVLLVTGREEAELTVRVYKSYSGAAKTPTRLSRFLIVSVVNYSLDHINSELLALLVLRLLLTLLCV